MNNHPVYGFKGYFNREYIATFFEWTDAVDFVSAHSERNLYIAPPTKRKKGQYRCAA